eukprot:6182016-Pleurochrysis_carterae.AAC.2
MRGVAWTRRKACGACLLVGRRHRDKLVRPDGAEPLGRREQLRARARAAAADAGRRHGRHRKDAERVAASIE